MEIDPYKNRLQTCKKRSSRKQKLVHTTLLAMVGLIAIDTLCKLGTEARSRPKNIDKLVAEFNEENGLNEEEGPDFYEMGIYEKSKT